MTVRPPVENFDPESFGRAQFKSAAIMGGAFAAVLFGLALLDVKTGWIDSVTQNWIDSWRESSIGQDVERNLPGPQNYRP